MWIASVLSNVGTWMHTVAAYWLMTMLATSPLPVALVQTATTLPVFLITIPAGALADLTDRRRWLIFTQIWMLVVADIFEPERVGKESRALFAVGDAQRDRFDARPGSFRQRQRQSGGIGDRAFKRRAREVKIDRLPHARLPGGRGRPRKKRQQRPRRSRLIAVVEMIGRRIVVVDGFLDQPQPGASLIKIQILFRVPGKRGDVVKPQEHYTQLITGLFRFATSALQLLRTTMVWSEKNVRRPDPPNCSGTAVIA